MQGISRRRFLRDASVGAAAVGTVAVIGSSTFATGAAGAAASALPVPVGAGTPGLPASGPAGPASEVMAHVVDAATGTVAVYSGTTKVTFQDRSVTDALLRATR